VLDKFSLRLISSLTLVMLSIGMLVACSKGSEAEQLAAMRDGFTYKQYRRVSENGLSFGLQAFLNASKAAGMEDVPEVTPEELCVLRMALAFSEVTRKKYTVALAETDIIESDKHCTQVDRTVATSIRAIIFQNLQWPTLAIAESRRARDADIPLSGESFNERLLMMHIALAYLYGSDKEWQKAKFHVDGIATMMELPWISKVADFALAVQEARIKDALRIAQALSQDPSVPADVRDYFASLYRDVGGDVARMATDPKYLVEMMMQVIWNAAKSKGTEQWKKLTTYIEHFDASQLPHDLNGAVEGAKSGLDKLIEKTGLGKERPDKAVPEDKSKTAPKGQ
jgi:hypothetical protein